MSYSQAQLDALRDAAASGVRTVKVDGKEVTYSSLAEMRQMIAVIERSMTPVSNRTTHFQATYDKGL